jgi:hypothetical protein
VEDEVEIRERRAQVRGHLLHLAGTVIGVVADVVHMMWRDDVVDHRKITCVPQLVEETPDDRLVGLVHDLT